jgi:predicted ATP-grasp superfamily ATP-dependent carboligase
MIIGLGSASSYKSIVIAQYIKKNYKGTFIIAFDKRKIINSIHSRFYDKVIIGDLDDPQKFFELVKRSNLDIFIPVDSSEYETIYSYTQFQRIPQLNFLGEKKSFLLLNDKSNLHKLAQKLGIKVPKTYYNELIRIIPNTVVKPTNLTSSKGVIFVTSQNISFAKRKAAQYDPFIVQEYIKGKGVGISIFAKNGKILTHYSHERLAEFPISGGSSSFRTSYYNENLLKIAEKIVSETKWSGFAMFEFKETSNNELYLIEVNPRIWGSINQGLQNGVNFFEEILGYTGAMELGKTINTYLAPLVFLSFAHYSMHFKFRPLYVFLRGIFNNKSDVNFFGDPKGFLSLLIRNL